MFLASICCADNLFHCFQAKNIKNEKDKIKKIIKAQQKLKSGEKTIYSSSSLSKYEVQMLFGQGLHFTEEPTELDFQKLSEEYDSEKVLDFIITWMNLDAIEIKKAMAKDVAYKDMIEPLIDQLVKDTFSLVTPLASLLIDEGVKYYEKLGEALWSHPAPQNVSQYGYRGLTLSRLKGLFLSYCISMHQHLCVSVKTKSSTKLTDSLKEMSLADVESSSSGCERDRGNEACRDNKNQRRERKSNLSENKEGNSSKKNVCDLHGTDRKLTGLHHSLAHVWFRLLEQLIDGCKSKLELV